MNFGYADTNLAKSRCLDFEEKSWFRGSLHLEFDTGTNQSVAHFMVLNDFNFLPADHQVLDIFLTSHFY